MSYPWLTSNGKQPTSKPQASSHSRPTSVLKTQTSAYAAKSPSNPKRVMVESNFGPLPHDPFTPQIESAFAPAYAPSYKSKPSSVSDGEKSSISVTSSVQRFEQRQTKTNGFHGLGNSGIGIPNGHPSTSQRISMAEAVDKLDHDFNDSKPNSNKQTNGKAMGNKVIQASSHKNADEKKQHPQNGLLSNLIEPPLKRKKTMDGSTETPSQRLIPLLSPTQRQQHQQPKHNVQQQQQQQKNQRNGSLLRDENVLVSPSVALRGFESPLQSKRLTNIDTHSKFKPTPSSPPSRQNLDRKSPLSPLSSSSASHRDIPPTAKGGSRFVTAGLNKPINEFNKVQPSLLGKKREREDSESSSSSPSSPSGSDMDSSDDSDSNESNGREVSDSEGDDEESDSEIEDQPPKKKAKASNNDSTPSPSSSTSSSRPSQTDTTKSSSLSSASSTQRISVFDSSFADALSGKLQLLRQRIAFKSAQDPANAKAPAVDSAKPPFPVIKMNRSTLTSSPSTDMNDGDVDDEEQRQGSLSRSLVSATNTTAFGRDFPFPPLLLSDVPAIWRAFHSWPESLLYKYDTLKRQPVLSNSNSSRGPLGGSHRPPGPGLANLGNTCFLNSVLQALIHIPQVCMWLCATATNTSLSASSASNVDLNNSNNNGRNGNSDLRRLGGIDNDDDTAKYFDTVRNLDPHTKACALRANGRFCALCGLQQLALVLNNLATPSHAPQQHNHPSKKFQQNTFGKQSNNHGQPTGGPEPLPKYNYNPQRGYLAPSYIYRNLSKVMVEMEMQGDQEDAHECLKALLDKVHTHWVLNYIACMEVGKDVVRRRSNDATNASLGLGNQSATNNTGTSTHPSAFAAPENDVDKVRSIIQDMSNTQLEKRLTMLPFKLPRNLSHIFAAPPNKPKPPSSNSASQDPSRKLPELKKQPPSVRVMEQYPMQAMQTSPVYALFGGTVRGQVKCKTCGTESNRYEDFLDLSLDVKSGSRDITSVHDALALFTRSEILEKDNAYSCDKCKKKVTAVRSSKIHSLPPVLTIHLKRFSKFGMYGRFGGGPKKVGHPVEYPSVLNVRRYTSKTLREAVQSRIKVKRTTDGSLHGELTEEEQLEVERYFGYHLAAVVVHTGSMYGGHYYSYIKGRSAAWFLADDEDVREVSKKEVLSQRNAYLLIYTKSTIPIPSTVKVDKYALFPSLKNLENDIDAITHPSKGNTPRNYGKDHQKKKGLVKHMGDNDSNDDSGGSGWLKDDSLVGSVSAVMSDDDEYDDTRTSSTENINHNDTTKKSIEQMWAMLKEKFVNDIKAGGIGDRVFVNDLKLTTGSSTPIPTQTVPIQPPEIATQTSAAVATKISSEKEKDVIEGEKQSETESETDSSEASQNHGEEDEVGEFEAYTEYIEEEDEDEDEDMREEDEDLFAEEMDDTDAGEEEEVESGVKVGSVGYYKQKMMHQSSGREVSHSDSDSDLEPEGSDEIGADRTEEDEDVEEDEDEDDNNEAEMSDHEDEDELSCDDESLEEDAEYNKDIDEGDENKAMQDDFAEDAALKAIEVQKRRLEKSFLHGNPLKLNKTESIPLAKPSKAAHPSISPHGSNSGDIATIKRQSPSFADALRNIDTLPVKRKQLEMSTSSQAEMSKLNENSEKDGTSAAIKANGKRTHTEMTRLSSKQLTRPEPSCKVASFIQTVPHSDSEDDGPPRKKQANIDNVLTAALSKPSPSSPSSTQPERPSQHKLPQPSSALTPSTIPSSVKDTYSSVIQSLPHDVRQKVSFTKDGEMRINGVPYEVYARTQARKERKREKEASLQNKHDLKAKERLVVQQRQAETNKQTLFLPPVVASWDEDDQGSSTTSNSTNMSKGSGISRQGNFAKGTLGFVKDKFEEKLDEGKVKKVKDKNKKTAAFTAGEKMVKRLEKLKAKKHRYEEIKHMKQIAQNTKQQTQGNIDPSTSQQESGPRSVSKVKSPYELLQREVMAKRAADPKSRLLTSSQLLNQAQLRVAKEERKGDKLTQQLNKKPTVDIFAESGIEPKKKKMKMEQSIFTMK